MRTQAERILKRNFVGTVHPCLVCASHRKREIRSELPGAAVDSGMQYQVHV